MTENGMVETENDEPLLLTQPGAGIRKSFDGPFLLDEGKLRKIAEILDEYRRKLDINTELIFYVRRSDGSYYQTYSVDDVLDEANIPSKRIVIVAMEIRSLDSPSPSRLNDNNNRRYLAAVVFRANKCDALYSIDARDRGWCFSLAEELETHICRCVRKPHLLLRSPRLLNQFSAFTIFSLGLATVVHLITNATTRLDPAAVQAMSVDEKLNEILMSRGANDWRFGLALAILIATMYAWLLLVTHRPIHHIAARVNQPCFYWNDEIARYDKAVSTWSMVKWVIGVGSIVSIVASLVVAWLV